jgi:hypothetical protein
MPADAESRLLDDVSDDWYALWEVDNLLSRSAPELEATSRRQLVSDLLARGALELIVAREWNSVRDTPPLAADEAITAISLSAAWDVPSAGDCVYAVGIART